MITAGLGTLGDVDGHDVGSGETNIFILTDQPQLAFERIKLILGATDLMEKGRVAYQEIGKDDFTILHPRELVHFSIL